MARCIDCTVDSMLTTTPFLRPLEGCDPSPTMSISPEALISPTIATTLEVPISRPTIISRSDFLDIAIPLDSSVVHGRVLPAHRESVAVTQIDRSHLCHT